MFKLLALSTVALATAKTYERNAPEHADVYSLRDTVAATTEQASTLATRVQALEETQMYTTVGVKLAATTMARIDNVMAKVAEVRTEVTASMAKLSKQIDTTVSYAGWQIHAMALRAAQAAALAQAATNNEA